MCFSLQMSLTASAFLFFIGIICLRRNHKKFLSYIPLLFAVQQLAEALVWASFDYHWDASWRKIFSYVFLIFAFVVWPFVIPYSFFQLEKDKQRRNFLKWICYLGLVVSTYLLIQLFYSPMNVNVVCSSINYYLESTPILDNVYLIYIYAFAVMSPCFISSLPRAKYFGVILFLSWAISGISYYYAFTSVWCFFAAILSSMIYYLL